MLLCHLLVFLYLIQSAASQACPACPVNGIWSDWNTTAKCPTPCGACSTTTQTRVCLSSQIGCPCTGEATATVPCNTQACIVPQANSRTKPCCTGTLKLTNNLYYCVPPVQVPGLKCCPYGGYWTNWGAYVKTPNKISWTRTRQCISEKSSCPCIGDNSQTTTVCPCLTPTVLPGWDRTCQNQRNLYMSNYTNIDSTIKTRPFVILRPALCQAYSIIEASTYRDEFVWTIQQPYVNATLIGNVDETGYCSVKQLVIGKVELSGSTYQVTYTCNLSTLRYEYGDLKGLYKISQFAMHSH